MSILSLSRVLIVGTLAAVLGGCGRGGPAQVDADWLAGVEEMRGAIASSTGFSPSSIEVMASAAHLRISISDARLAQADQAAREEAATGVMTAAERSLAKNSRFSSVQQLSVAIVHPGAAASDMHIEDVVDFRRGPDQRFSKHTT
ncbi:MAG: hypothetical protein JSR36_02945 [Proteobacteria bacterium]|nr:hypothetical protein [Pseudomonadota bacterium]